MILQEEPTSLKDKVIRVFVGIFLTILVVMLVVTLLPGDLETGFIAMFEGKDTSNAGKIGRITIPMDYFHAARKDCYYRYKQYAPALAENNDNINSCAYQLVQNLKIAGMIAEKTGFTVSEHSIRMDLSDQAREIYKNSVSAGYAKDELSQPDEIYKQLVKSAPMPYRIDTYVASGLFDRFLNTVIKKTDAESKLEGEITSATVSLNIVTFNDTSILDRLDKEILISEEMIKKEYESAKEQEPLDKKKQFIISKLKAKEKQKRLKELKDKLKLVKSLAEIAKLTSSNVVQLNQPLGNLNNLNLSGKNVNLASSTEFWKDLTSAKFNSGKIGGPYTSAEYTTFIEFTGFKINQGNNPQIKKDTELVFEFFNEINQSLTESFPIKRNLTGSSNAN